MHPVKSRARDILCIGESAVDVLGFTGRLVDSESSMHLTKLRESYGGRGSNFLIFSRVFGADSLLVSPVGYDFGSLGYALYFEKSRIDTSGLFRSEKSATPRAFIFSDKQDSRTFFYGGVLNNERDAFAKHALSLVKKTDYRALYCTAGLREINEQALAISKASLNCYAPGHEIFYNTSRGLKKCLSCTNLLFLNELEAQIMEKKLKSPIEHLMEDYGIKIAIVTLGGNGSELHVDGAHIHILPYKPRRVINTAGPGDAFAGAFVANYLKSKDAVYSARVASATASFVVEELGCQANIPEIGEIMRRMKGTET